MQAEVSSSTMAVTNVDLQRAEIVARAQQQLDLGHYDVLSVRALLIGVIYLCLAGVNYFGFDPEPGLLLAAMAGVVGVVFCLLSFAYRRIEIPLHQVNGIAFAELAFLQLDGMFFLVLTQDIMNSYGVFVMMISAGIFMTRFKWWLATMLVLLTSWIAALVIGDVALNLVRESLMVVASVGGSILFFVLRRRSAIRLSETELTKDAYLHQLEDALQKIETLSGLLPICSHCKNIRDESGHWQQVEVYVRDHTRASFSHGICPDCKSAVYGDQAEEVT